MSNRVEAFVANVAAVTRNYSVNPRLGNSF